MSAPAIDPAEISHAEADRGRMAERPGQIRRKGWWDVAWRVKGQIEADNVSIVAGGLALFAMLSLFPSLSAAVAIYGLLASPEAIAAQIQSFSGLLPPAVLEILESQLNDLTGQNGNALSAGAALGILLALWSARKGMMALITAMNVAYNERDRRSFLRRLGVSFAFTIGGIVGFVLMVLLGVAVPVVLSIFPQGMMADVLLLTVRWFLLWLIAVLALSALYRFAPHRARPRWQWVSPGSLIAATLWIVGSIAFALYVRNFNSFGEAYGAIGGVVVMLMWFYVSSFVVILGAEVNSELERQTVIDTTVGDSRPMGERGAYSADTLGPRAGTA